MANCLTPGANAKLDTFQGLRSSSACVEYISRCLILVLFFCLLLRACYFDLITNIVELCCMLYDDACLFINWIICWTVITLMDKFYMFYIFAVLRNFMEIFNKTCAYCIRKLKKALLFWSEWNIVTPKWCFGIAICTAFCASTLKLTQNENCPKLYVSLFIISDYTIIDNKKRSISNFIRMMMDDILYIVMLLSFRYIISKNNEQSTNNNTNIRRRY